MKADTSVPPVSRTSGLGKSDKPEPRPGETPAEAKRYLKLQNQIEENLIGLAGAMAAIPFLQKDAITTLEHTPGLSDAWVNICRRDKRMLEATERFMQNSVWIPLIGVLGAYSVSIAANHGINLLKPFGFKFEKKQENADNTSDQMSEEQRMGLLFGTMLARQAERNAEISGDN